MRTTEYPAHPPGKLVCSQKPLRLYDLALGVYPLRLDGVQPRTLLRKQATDDPHSAAALLDAAVVFPEPTPHLFRDMPAGVVPDENKELLAHLFELLKAPGKEPRRYRRNWPAVHEPDPRFIDLWQIESVAGYGLRLGVVPCDRWMRRGGLPSSAQAFSVGSAKSGPTSTRRRSPPPTRGRLRRSPSVGRAFFFSFVEGSGEVIHRFARIHLTPSRREKVARMVSPETRSVVSPSSKATSATISKVQRLELRPNSLGERWSICLSASALFSSKAVCTRFGREEPGVRASRPLSLKARMAFLTVCEAHPRLRAIFRGDSPRALARRIWQRRITKASLERSPAWIRSRSFFDGSRTKIGGFMPNTIAHNTLPSLRMH